MMETLAALVTATSWNRNMLLVTLVNYFSKLCNHRHLAREGLGRGATPAEHRAQAALSEGTPWTWAFGCVGVREDFNGWADATSKPHFRLNF